MARALVIDSHSSSIINDNRKHFFQNCLFLGSGCYFFLFLLFQWMIRVEEANLRGEFFALNTRFPMCVYVCVCVCMCVCVCTCVCAHVCKREDGK